jgi:hypothetical protein
MSAEPQFSRVMSSFPGYKPLGQYYTLNKRDWNGKSTFPDLKYVSSDRTLDPQSSKSHETIEPPTFHRNKSDNNLRHYPINTGRGYLDAIGQYDPYPTFSRPVRKWSEDDLESYFAHLRITPRRHNDLATTDDVERRAASPGLVRPMPMRPEDFFRRSDRESGISPNDSDDSISSESLGTSSGNSFSFVNASVGVNVPERNKVVLDRIRRGLDARTTIMVKNVPNKYTQVLSLEQH